LGISIDNHCYLQEKMQNQITIWYWYCDCKNKESVCKRR